MFPHYFPSLTSQSCKDQRNPPLPPPLWLSFLQVTANHSISLAQFDYTVEFEEEYREAIASGQSPALSWHQDIMEDV